MEQLEKREIQRSVERKDSEQHHRADKRAAELPEQFLSAGQPLAASPLEFEIVVRQTDRAVGDRYENRDIDIRIAQVGEQNRRGETGRDDQQSAHRRRTGFLLMALRDLFANRLSDIRETKAADQ